MIAQCKICKTKYNNDTVDDCPICFWKPRSITRDKIMYDKPGDEARNVDDKEYKCAGCGKVVYRRFITSGQPRCFECKKEMRRERTLLHKHNLAKIR